VDDIKMLGARKRRDRREQVKILIRLDPRDHELLKKHKGCLSWRSILYRCVLRDLSWRLEELDFHLNRIVALFPELKDIVEEFREKLLSMIKQSYGDQ